MSELTINDDPSERVHLQSYQSAVWLPLLQAAITGGLLGIAVALLAYLAGVDQPIIWGAVAWVSVQLVVWLILIQRWASLTRPLERLTGYDLDGDGLVDNEPVAEPETVRVVVDSLEDRKTLYIDLPTSREKLTRLAAGLLTGKTMSEATWTGGSGLFSKAEFRRLRDEMLRRGLIRWNNPNYRAQGVVLSRSGDSLMRKLTSPAPPSGKQ